MRGAAKLFFTFEKEKKIMKNKFTEKIVKILVTALCPLLLMSACYKPNRSSERMVNGLYSGITFGIDSAVN